MSMSTVEELQKENDANIAARLKKEGEGVTMEFVNTVGNIRAHFADPSESVPEEKKQQYLTELRYEKNLLLSAINRIESVGDPDEMGTVETIKGDGRDMPGPIDQGKKTSLSTGKFQSNYGQPPDSTNKNVQKGLRILKEIKKREQLDLVSYIHADTIETCSPESETGHDFQLLILKDTSPQPGYGDTKHVTHWALYCARCGRTLSDSFEDHF